MSGVQNLQVGYDDDGIRLDRWFRRNVPGLPVTRLQRMCRKGEVRVNGKRVKPNARVSTGEMIRVPPFEQDPERLARAEKPTVSDKDAEFIQSLVLYKDDDVIVINKPPGVPTQGGPKITRHLDGMLDGLKFGAKRPKLVHRLDKDTSGVLLLGRNDRATRALTAAFRERSAEKIYWALTKRVPRPHQGTIRMALSKASGKDGERMVPDRDGKPSVTLYSVIEDATKAAWVACKPLTGRTHQLRVHLAEIGHPIVGDGKYGAEEQEGAYLTGSVSKKLHLHARSIRLAHPSGGDLNVTAPLPRHMAATWALFDFDPNYAEDPFEDAE